MTKKKQTKNQPQKYPHSLLKAEAIPDLKPREVHKELVQDQAHANRFHREETQPSANYMGIYMFSQGNETPKSSEPFLFFFYFLKSGHLFTCCSVKEFVVVFKLFLVTPEACETLIGASWARTAHTSLGKDLEIHFARERGKKNNSWKAKKE